MDNSDHFKTLMNWFTALALLFVLMTLFIVHKNYNKDMGVLITSVTANILSTTLIALVVLLVYRMLIFPKIDSINHALSDDEGELINLSGKIDKLTSQYDDVFFAKSNKTHYEEIMIHYVNQKNNCLDFIALCNEKEMLGYQVHPDFKERLRKNNVNTDVDSQIKKYKDLSGEYTAVLNVISKELHKIDQGGLKKIAFDVKVGGVFYYICNEEKEKNKYLFGATVDQGAMDSGLAYKEMEYIFEEIERQLL